MIAISEVVVSKTFIVITSIGILIAGGNKDGADRADMAEMADAGSVIMAEASQTDHTDPLDIDVDKI